MRTEPEFSTLDVLIRPRSLWKAAAALALLAFLPVPPSLAQYPNQTINGPSPNGVFGSSLVGNVDFNKDGTKELAIGAPRLSNAQGEVLVYSVNGTLETTLVGTAANDFFGQVMAAAGDLNGDGYPDILIAAPSSCGTNNAGYVRAVSGKDWSTLYTIQGGLTTRFGETVAGIGDINGDGKSDFIVGDSQALPQFTTPPRCTYAAKGLVTIYSGANGSVITTRSGDNYGDFFGLAVGSVGDVDGDGIPDYAATSELDHSNPNMAQQGYLRVFSGRTGTLIYSKTNLPGQAYGKILPVADVDGDGTMDFIMSFLTTVSGTGAGAVQMRSGRTGNVIWTTSGIFNGDSFGFSTALIGDYDGDGVPDILAGSNAVSIPGLGVPPLTGYGYAEILSGKTGAVLQIFKAAAQNDGFGSAVACVGDVNGDSKNDFAIGAPFDSTRYSNAGSVQTFFAPKGQPISNTMDFYPLGGHAVGFL